MNNTTHKYNYGFFSIDYETGHKFNAKKPQIGIITYLSAVDQWVERLLVAVVGMLQ